MIMYSLILNTFTIKLINSINITTFSWLAEVRKIPFKVEIFHEISLIIFALFVIIEFSLFSLI